MNLEVDVIPVSDVERSKQFYQLLGWRLDEDVAPAKEVRIVQFTPPGSGCSVTFGNGVTAAAPGSAAGALIVSDIEAAHDELIRRGIDASEMWHGAPFPRRRGFPARIPSARATGRSSPSMIPTAIRGWFRRLQRGAPVASDTAFTFTGSANKNKKLVRRTPEVSLATVRLIVSAMPALVRRPRRSNVRLREHRSATGRQNLVRNQDGRDQRGSHAQT